MYDLEQLADALESEGYHVTLQRNRGTWHCALFTHRTFRPPVGSGKTGIDAVVAAVEDKNRLLLEMKSGKG